MPENIHEQISREHWARENPGFRSFIARIFIIEHKRGHGWPTNWWVIDEFRIQKEIIAHRGHCQENCAAHCILLTPMGRPVCRWSRDHCPQLGMAALVETYSKIGGLNR